LEVGFEPAFETPEEDSPQCDPASPDLVIVWEPAVLNDQGYALLVALLGDQERFTLGLLPDSGSFLPARRLSVSGGR